MRVHLIYAHPSNSSFASAMRDRVVAALKAQGHEVDELDLYQAGFDPVMSEAEWRENKNPGANIARVADEAARLRQAEALVLCFPTWWYGMPAILKGWFDRVWAPGVAFHLPKGGGQIQRGLTNIKRLAVITSHGSPWWFINLVLGNPGKTVLMGGLAQLIAPGAATQYLAVYDMDKDDRPRLEKFLARVDRVFQRFG